MVALPLRSAIDAADADPRARPLSALDAAACAYLALPVLIFCAWFRWPVAALFALLALLGWRNAFAGRRPARWEIGARTAAALFAFALAWTATGGIGHFLHANSDWPTRDAVLRDLARTPWPPAYELGAHPLILRAPVGYYLPASLVGSLLGVRAADIALYLWTAAGFALFLGLATTLFEKPAQRALACVVLVAFGGLDYAGFTLVEQRWPAPGEFIGWWAGSVQYSSNAALLFWVPNHALPAWLATLLVLRHWRAPALARIAPLCLACVPLWSPLAAVGLLPFLLAGIDWRRSDALRALLAGLPWLALAFVEARYLTLDSRTIAAGWLPHWYHDPRRFLILYALFCALEFGVLALVLLRLGADSTPLRLAIAILLLLPLYRFGPSNDLPMRASIPALTVLALATVAPLTGRGPLAWRAALAGLLAIGALGAAQEPERAFLAPRWDPPDLSLARLYAGAGEPLPPHYVARLAPSSALSRLLREPHLAPPVAPPAARPAAPSDGMPPRPVP
jgi:hypothetical protein